MKLPAYLEPIIFGLLLSGLMSLVVAGMATWHALGWVSAFVEQWMASWLLGWSVAFPSVLVIAPIVRRITHSLVARQAPN